MILTKFRNFDVWHKILQGHQKSKAGFKKPLSQILSGFFHFWPSSSQKVIIVPSKRWNIFSSTMANGVSKNRLFILISKMYIWSQQKKWSNVHFEISMRDDFFDTPVDLFKEKIESHRKGQCVLFSIIEDSHYSGRQNHWFLQAEFTAQ